MITADFVVVGAGIIGINVARGLKRRFRDARVVLLEKEADCGLHASGRNSGVLHAGFYYPPDGMKARFARRGNRALVDYCEARGIPVNRCGKLVIARNEGEHAGLDELLRRGVANGVPLDAVSEADARRIEPRARTCGRAIFSPTTASVNPRRVMQAMKCDVIEDGVQVHTGTKYLSRDGKDIRTSAGRYTARYFVNTAGLYADRIAREFGFSEDYCILPFKGLYLYSDEPAGSLRTNVYPVPDLRNPFLGVHYTVTAEGGVKIGPTAIPVAWREHYGGVRGFRAGEMLEIVRRQARLFISSSFDFKRIALDELKKHSRRRMVAEAAAMVRDVDERNYRRWAAPGIRAQLYNTRTRQLAMDFVIQGDEHSMHVLNAVSPAFTCALPFADHVCDEIGRLIH